MADTLANPDEINKPADDESWTERESDASVENPPTYPKSNSTCICFSDESSNE